MRTRHCHHETTTTTRRGLAITTPMRQRVGRSSITTCDALQNTTAAVKTTKWQPRFALVVHHNTRECVCRRRPSHRLSVLTYSAYSSSYLPGGRDELSQQQHRLKKAPASTLRFRLPSPGGLTSSRGCAVDNMGKKPLRATFSAKRTQMDRPTIGNCCRGGKKCPAPSEVGAAGAWSKGLTANACI